jgi:hypothetical protein
VTITGTVTVRNLPGGSATGSVPVCGAYVTAGPGHAITDANGAFTVTDSAAQPGDQVPIVVWAATDLSVWAGPGYAAWQPAAAGQGAAIYSVTDAYQSHDPTQGPNVAAVVIDGSRSGAFLQEAEAFAIFSVTAAYYAYAQSLGAQIPPFTIAFPADETETTAANMSFTPGDLFGPASQPGGSAPLFAALVGHEFGHLVADNNGFGSPPGGTSETYKHFTWQNERAVPSQHPGATDPNIPMSASDQQIGFAEGWADYFAEAGAAWSQSDGPYWFPAVPSIVSLATGNVPWSQAPISEPGGRGEDNESSVMRVLWRLANDPSMGQFVPNGLLFQNVLAGSGIVTLSALWNNLVPDTTSSAGAQRAVQLGAMFASMSVSPTVGADGVNPSQHSFTFVVPDLCGPDGWIYQATFDNATLRVFSEQAGGSWALATTNPIPINLTGVASGVSQGANYTTFRYTVSDAAWTQIINPALGAVRHWAITGGQTVAGSGAISGQYWSGAETFHVAGMNPKKFRSGMSTNGTTYNDPQLVYDIVVPPGDENTVTIPGFTIFVGAGSGVFGEPDATAGIYYVGDPQNAPDLPGICVIDATGTNDLTATAGDFERTVTLPASALSATVIEGCWETAYNSYTITDPYLVASIEFDGDTNGNDNIPVRFEGGAFQMDDGTVFVESSASLDDSTPDSDVANTITLASGLDTLTVSGQGGTPWDPISYTETFSGAGTAYVFAHDGDDLVDARATQGPLTVDVEAESGDNTILGGEGGTLLVGALDGDNTVSCGGEDIAQVQLGSGQNTLYAGGYDDQIGVQDGDNTFYLGNASGEGVYPGSGNNLFVVGMGIPGSTQICPGDGADVGDNYLVLSCTATSQLPNLGVLEYPDGSLLSPADRALDYTGIAGLKGLDFEGGGTCSVPSSAPSPLDVAVGTGTTLDGAKGIVFRRRGEGDVVRLAA